jgi:hypothetical protein
MHAGTQVVNPMTSPPTKETKSSLNLKEAPWQDEQSLSFIENFNGFPTNGKSRIKKLEAFLNHDSSFELRQLRPGVTVKSLSGQLDRLKAKYAEAKGTMGS